jgi:hypothetical protein
MMRYTTKCTSVTRNDLISARRGSMEPIAVAARSGARGPGRLGSEIVGLNSAQAMDVCVRPSASCYTVGSPRR